MTTILISALGTITEGLVKGLEDMKIRGQVETIQTTALLRSVRILRRVWRLEETFSHSNFNTDANANVKKLSRVIIIIIIVIIICLHRVMRYQVFLSNTNNLHTASSNCSHSRTTIISLLIVAFFI